MTTPTSPEFSTMSEIVRVFGDPRFHADGELQALGFAADGTLWSVEEPGIMRQWRPGSGLPIQRHYLSEVETLWAFSDPAQLLASATDELSIWNAGTGEQIASLEQPAWVTALAIHPDRSLVASGQDDGKVQLWDIEKESMVCEIGEHTKPISAMAFSKDGQRLATAGEDRAIHIWEVPGGKKLGSLLGHTDRIPSLAWNHDGSKLVSAGWDTTARVWDTKTFEPVILLNSHADQVHAVAFSPDGRLLACADSGYSIHLWHTVAWKTVHILNEHHDEIRCLSFSPDGKQLASAGLEGVIHLWDVQQGQLLSHKNNDTRHSITVVKSSRGSRLSSSCGGTAFHCWDAASGKPLETEELPNVLAVTGSNDGRWLASGGADARIVLWDAATGRPHVTMFGQRGPAAAVALAPNHKILAAASASDGVVWLWDFEKAEPVLVIPEAADGCTVESLAFHPSKRILACGGIDYLATGGTDGAVCLWDIDQRSKVGMFEYGTTAFAFHPSGNWLAVASLKELIYVWDIEKEDVLAELGGHREGVNCVAISPDGKWLVSGSDDRHLRIWQADSRELAIAHELDSPIKALCFSPDSRFVYTANGNTTCYQVELAKVLEE